MSNNFLIVKNSNILDVLVYPNIVQDIFADKYHIPGNQTSHAPRLP